MSMSSSESYNASSDSDEEADDRPNRWQGPPSTWQDMNREEINTLTALDEIGNRDLSVHLYNAFALKQRHGKEDMVGDPATEKDIDAVTGLPIQPDNWAPPRSWTAWPMSKDKVPLGDFMGNSLEDKDDSLTLRPPKPEVPSLELEEAVGAVMLKFAKDKFNKRTWEEMNSGEESDESLDAESELDQGSESDDATTERESRSPSQSRARGVKERPPRHADDMPQDVGEGSSDEEPLETSIRPGILKPVVTTDDELSYAIMRPVVRSILTKLDATLMVLRRQPGGADDCLSDDTDDSAGSISERAKRSNSKGSESPAKRRRGRPQKTGIALRLRTPPPLEDSPAPQQATDLSSAQTPTKRKAGRPRKVYPRLPGETDRDWAVRVARLRKEPIPFFRGEQESEEAGSSNLEIQSPRKRHIARAKWSRSRNPSPHGEGEESEQPRSDKHGARLGLRDWRDVLGAAALAGFTHAALDRAARRCADLFGQSTQLVTMEERPLGESTLDKVINYHPGMISNFAIEEGDSEDNDEDSMSQTKRHIRASSIASNSRGRSESRSRSRSRISRSRSRSLSVAGSHFCAIKSCPRHLDGFSRRPNLLRHMKEIHGISKENMPAEVDSEDETFGAVHTDGFLKPIKIRKGWRGDDEVKRRARARRRGEDDAENEDEDVAMRDSS
ncbi:RNA polymerase I-specific transcription initiation factor-domain-containing protein [Xylariales sp. PMI_506]|nr:RNA polymerase I-specific transcription initiation factor-domain-containing protein [Xylariales sp. PMI_506]